MLFWKINRSAIYMKFEKPHSRKGECMWLNQEIEACRNARRPSHSFAKWSADNGRVARRLKETSNGAGVKNTELQISKSRIGEAPAPAFFGSVFSPLSIFGNAVCGRAASGKRRWRHCHYLIMLRPATTMLCRRVFLEFNTATLIQFLRPTWFKYANLLNLRCQKSCKR